jgi:hypothetical protein
MTREHYKPHSNLLPPKGKRLSVQRVKYLVALSRFKISAFVVIHPIVLSVAISLAVVLYPTYLLYEQGATIRSQNHRLAVLLARSQQNRKEATATSCAVQNSSITVNNHIVDVLVAIIVQSVKASKPLEHVYRSLGLPPYDERLAQAIKTAAPLNALKQPTIDCAERVRAIDQSVKKP